MEHKDLSSLFAGRVTLRVRGSLVTYDRRFVMIAQSLDEARDILLRRFDCCPDEIIDLNVWSEDFPIAEVEP